MTRSQEDKIRAAKGALGVVDVMMIRGGLEELLWLQSDISNLVPGAVDKTPSNDQIAYGTYALVAELVELADELGWKKWKDNPTIDGEQQEKIAEEFADVLAFLGQLLYLVQQRSGISPSDIAAAYYEKSKKNVARFLGETDEPGYNGVVNGDERS